MLKVQLYNFHGEIATEAKAEWIEALCECRFCRQDPTTRPVEALITTPDHGETIIMGFACTARHGWVVLEDGVQVFPPAL